MEDEALSPRITAVSWGRLEVAGRDQPFKDAKLFPGGAREWDWTETGTDHGAGIRPADVRELLEHGATVVVLSQGIYGRLRVDPETVKLLAARGIPTHVHRTEKAVRVYNQLRESEPVGGLFHTTC